LNKHLLIAGKIGKRIHSVAQRGGHRPAQRAECTRERPSTVAQTRAGLARRGRVRAAQQATGVNASAAQSGGRGCERADAAAYFYRIQRFIFLNENGHKTCVTCG